MYVSTQKFPQIFLYMSTTCCESFKSFGEVRKKFFISNFYDPEISSPAKNGMSLTAPYTEVSSPIYNLFLPELLQYIGNMFKKSLNPYDTCFGFYGNFRKGTFGLPYEHGRAKWFNTYMIPSLLFSNLGPQLRSTTLHFFPTKPLSVSLPAGACIMPIAGSDAP